jgi:hypothetical protein
MASDAAAGEPVHDPGLAADGGAPAGPSQPPRNAPADAIGTTPAAEAGAAEAGAAEPAPTKRIADPAVVLIMDAPIQGGAQIGAGFAKPAAKPTNAGRPSAAHDRVISRVESLRAGIEELVEAFGACGAGTSLPDEVLTGAVYDAPRITVRAWLHSLLRLGRIVAPACCEALQACDLDRACSLMAELAQAAPVVSSVVRASIGLAGFTLDASTTAAETAAPQLRRALTSDAVAHSLACLLSDLTSLEMWLGSVRPAQDTRLVVPPGWPQTLAARAPHDVGLLPLPHYTGSHGSALTGLPPLSPDRLDNPARSDHALSAATRSDRRALSVVPPRHLVGAASAESRAPAEAEPIEITDEGRQRIARGDRRILAGVIACTLVLLLLAGVTELLGARQGTGAQASAGGNVATPAGALITAPTDTPAPDATPSPTAPPSTPTPLPTKTPLPAVARPAAAPHAPAVVPTVRSLTLRCGASGVSLPLRNPSAAVQSWSLGLPAGVRADGVRGTVNPGMTLWVGVWEVAGGPSGQATLYVRSAGGETPVVVTLPGC